MSILEFLFNILDIPMTLDSFYYIYIIAGIVTLVLLDGIISFIVGALSGLFYKNRY